MNLYSDGPTITEVGVALGKAVGTLVLLYFVLLLAGWLVTTFGEVTGMVLFFGGPPVLAGVGIAALAVWYRRHPTASVRAPSPLDPRPS
jgi:phage-related protein